MALQRFIGEKLPSFGSGRSKMDGSGTSLLSPHIHYGEISVGFIYHVVSAP